MRTSKVAGAIPAFRLWPALAFLIPACGAVERVPMINAPRAPAAQGTVVARPEANGNTRLAVEVKHLASPDKVAPGAKVYVVWVLPPGGRPQNVGALRVGEDLSGRLDTVTVHPSFMVKLTAEGSPAAAAPFGPEVLQALVTQ
jgi:hypothetical protein